VKKLIVILSVLVILTGFVFAATDTAGSQIGVTVENIAQLAIANVTGAAFEIEAATTEGGIPTINWTDSDGGDLQFTSTASDTYTRKITAQIAEGNLTWFTLKVALAALNGNESGSCGTNAAADATTIPSATSVDLVTGIGTGWTGTGVGDGYGITYSGDIVPASAADMDIDTYTISVTYTITEGEA